VQSKMLWRGDMYKAQPWSCGLCLAQYRQTKEWLLFSAVSSDRQHARHHKEARGEASNLALQNTERLPGGEDLPLLPTLSRLLPSWFCSPRVPPRLQALPCSQSVA
jgi:hypothetical protein